MTICSTQKDDIDTIVVTQGEDATFEIFVVDALGAPFDLTGIQGFFTVKARWKDSATIIAKRTTNAGGDDTQFVVLAQTGLTKGRARFFVVPTDTSTLTNEQVDNANAYVYDVWIVTATGKHKVVRKLRSFEIWPRVTVIP